MSQASIIVKKNFLSIEECNRIIDKMEKIGFDKQFAKDNRLIRTRCVFEDIQLSDKIWVKIKNDIPSLAKMYPDSIKPFPESKFPLDEYIPVGTNALFRCYKYGVNEEFRRHHDFSHEYSEYERTFYTILIYLNQDFAGGTTAFDDYSIEPSTGAFVMFPHEFMHESQPLTSGIKYTLRTDLVFSIKPGA